MWKALTVVRCFVDVKNLFLSLVAFVERPVFRCCVYYYSPRLAQSSSLVVAVVWHVLVSEVFEDLFSFGRSDTSLAPDQDVVVNNDRMAVAAAVVPTSCVCGKKPHMKTS